ncbi:MAG: hypothetical protein L6V93_02570 [Clostridiales bacterium]|nr:MAG: hypothetical protein L6V93_02570 [Clostridiales bacterium]
MLYVFFAYICLGALMFTAFGFFGAGGREVGRREQESYKRRYGKKH